MWRGWSSGHAPLAGEQEGCLPTLTQPSHAFLPILLLKALPHSEVCAQVSILASAQRAELQVTGLSEQAFLDSVCPLPSYPLTLSGQMWAHINKDSEDLSLAFNPQGIELFGKRLNKIMNVNTLRIKIHGQKVVLAGGFVHGTLSPCRPPLCSFGYLFFWGGGAPL